MSPSPWVKGLNYTRYIFVIRLEGYNLFSLHNEYIDQFSDATGLCGCDLPKQAYKSSGNFLTLGFSTKCDNATQHGEFELIISAFKKGKQLQT